MGTNITATSYYEPHSTILRVLKHISDEAMSIFYSESTFHLYLYVCSPKTLTDRMMRIHYHILGVGDSFSSHKNAESLQPSNWTNPENMKAICDNTIGQLVGTDITRSHIWITLYDITDLTHAFTSPLFQAFAGFTTFREFMLELRFSLTLNVESDEKIDIQIASDRMKKNMWAIEAYLVPVLGPIADGCLGLSGEENYYGITMVSLPSNPISTSSASHA